MNKNLVFISNINSSFNNTLKEELSPSYPTIVQINKIYEPFVSLKFKKNISIPFFDILTDYDIVRGYDFVDHVCATNDFSKEILQNLIPNKNITKLNYLWNSHNNTLNINTIYKTYYKYAAIFDFTEDLTVIQDLIYIFYEATKNISDICLILYIKHNNSQEVYQVISDIYKKLKISFIKHKIILYVQSKFSEDEEIAAINTCDAFLIINSININPLYYYQSVYMNKRVISKHNLDKKIEINLLPTTHKMFRYNNKKNFCYHVDLKSLYDEIENPNNKNTIKRELAKPTTTEIQKLL